MQIILLGSPGAGKGTQAKFITQRYHIPQISTGDMLRAEINSGSQFGRLVKKTMDNGILIPDNVIIQLVKSRIRQPDCENGFLLDGFPRTLNQAEALKEEKIKIDHVIEIDVDDEEIVKRMSGRRVHPASGRVYHEVLHPPRVAGKDDVTGEPLVQREDDREAIVRKRLEVYHQQTKPLIEYYQQLSRNDGADAPRYTRIRGIGSVEEISQQIQKILEPDHQHH